MATEVSTLFRGMHCFRRGKFVLVKFALSDVTSRAGSRLLSVVKVSDARFFRREIRFLLFVD